MKDIRNEIQNYISDKIKITEKMGLEVTDINEKGLTIRLPLHPNINDKGSGFAGSLYSSLVLSGWAFLQALCMKMETEHDIMIVESKTEYQRPITNDCQACARLKKSDSYGDLLRRIPNEKKFFVEIIATLENFRGPAVTFHGTYCLKKRINS